MTDTEQITLYLQPALEPVISSDELTLILELARRADSEGIAPGETDWIETVDINWAICEGFRIKAAKVVGGYHFKDEGQDFAREQVLDHCLKMAKMWKGKSASSVSLGEDEKDTYRRSLINLYEVDRNERPY